MLYILYIIIYNIYRLLYTHFWFAIMNCNTVTIVTFVSVVVLGLAQHRIPQKTGEIFLQITPLFARNLYFCGQKGAKTEIIRSFENKISRKLNYDQ